MYYPAFVSLLFSGVVFSQTLCLENETDFFSCTTTNNKIISICGEISNDEPSDDWLQYRFGKKDHIELVYPESKNSSISKFEGNTFSRYSVIDLRFINGRNAYSVSLNGPYDGDEATIRTTASAGVSIKLKSKKNVSISCSTIDSKKYYSNFENLNNELRFRNGDTDLFYKEQMY
nr:hypothetical protein [uncultured Tolumonas sp.]